MEHISFNEDIISRKSVAGICLNQHMDEVLPLLYAEKMQVQEKIYDHSNGRFYSYIINDGTVTINTDKNRIIISIGCNQNYKGKYKGIFATQMKVSDIIKNSSSQRILNGSLIIDNDFGFSYILPNPHNEIADYIHHLPKDLILNEILVADFEWWIKPELTPDYAKG